MNNEYDDDPFDEIMSEGGSDGPTAPSRYINHGGSSGRYIVPFRELDKDELKKLSDENLLAYQAKKEIEEQTADRAKFQAIVLYLPEDSGRALWPDGTIFKGTHPLCQSERTAPPYDTARVNNKLDPIVKLAMKEGGHTGSCSTCGISDKLCKLRLVAYVFDLGHFAAVNAWNAANPENTVEHTFSKVDAKGPQSYWNFKACYNKLLRQAKESGIKLGDYVVEFKSEPGSQGSKKVCFEIVRPLDADDPLRAMARIVARQALVASKVIRKAFNPSLNAGKSAPALPSGSAIDEEYLNVDEIPF